MKIKIQSKKAELSYLVKILMWIVFILLGCAGIYYAAKFIGIL